MEVSYKQEEYEFEGCW